MLSQLVVCRKAKLKFVYLKLMRMVELSTVVPPFLKAKKVQERVALTDANDTYSYKNLFENSKLFARKILNTYGQKHILNGDRIAFLCPNDISYTVVQWACWMAGAMVVPLCYDYPLNKIEFLVKDAQCSLIISSQECKDKGSLIASSSQILHFPIDKIDINNPNIKSKEDCDLESKWEEIDWSAKRAMLVYTSGTTGPPKGVVWTFKMLQAQNEMMISTWGISKSDCVLHTLPLHHVHGIVNALSCPLWAGASCFMMQEFDAEKVWQQLLENSKINVFHAVPTIYSILIQHYDGHFLSAEKRIKIREVLENKIRLMVSGSAALPDCIMNRWKEISGHTLLERYGMSEIGMALTNSLHGQRIPGAVGKPFPSVELQIKSLNGETLVEASFEKVIVKQGITDLAGNLLVKGPSVFSEYWNQEKATLESFTDDGWFLTGDTAMYDQNNDVFRILGCTSVDIIKSGGYKISALDIERHLLEHPSVKEVAIVGLPDPTWGEIIAAVVALSSPLDFKDMQAWCSTKMPRHHIPRKIEIVDKIQRNAMGKVSKKELKKDIFKV